MHRRGLFSGILALAAAALLIGATRPKEPDWSAMVTISKQGYHVRGNPNAAIHLIEYASYTCPHCGIFEMEGGEELLQRFIKTGAVAYEIRPFFLNEIDKAVALTEGSGWWGNVHWKVITSRDEIGRAHV